MQNESTWVRILMSTSVYYFRIFFLKATNSYLIFTAYASMKKCSYSKYTVQRGLWKVTGRHLKSIYSYLHKFKQKWYSLLWALLHPL